MATPPPDPVDYPARLRAALAALQKQQARIDQLERQLHEPIAVIGIGCRFPGGADSPARFWSLLQEGFDAIDVVPPDRWRVDDFYDPDPDAPGKTYTRAGGFLRDVDRFDARFFRIAPREAVSMDPQQRLLLEVSWEAIEDAAIPADTLNGSATGVFVGLTVEDYAKLVCRTDLTRVDTYTATGNVANIAAGRLSYFYGLRGPSLAVDTACSSSLVSVHLACQSLRTGECDLALAAGVNLILAPDNTIAVSRAHMLSPDGRCKAFDASADGYARSEGCGVVVLERLSQAQAKGRRILAVIRGSAVRQDGARSGLTVPNGPAQQAVMEAALRAAGVESTEVGYLEAHGTGTSLGDPIEVEAIAGVYGRKRPRERPLVIGALKTNVGHMESAAGIGGVIKASLALRHGAVPAHLHLRTVNPNIFLDEIPAVVPTRSLPWPDAYGRRLAGVSSFGSCGTIAHVVLEAPPAEPTIATPAAAAPEAPELLAISAATEPALVELASRYDAHLATEPASALADICHTARVGRTAFSRRVAAVGRTPDEMRASLRAAIATRGDADAATSVSRAPDVAFVFTGQGALRAGVGRELYDAWPAFRAAIDRCAAAIAGELPRPLVELLFGADADAWLESTRYGQPALFALQVALVELWKSWGIRPSVVLGHSLGEFAAACTAGVLAIEDALRLVVARGRLMEETEPGRMVAVFGTEAACREAMAGETRVAIAAVNGDADVVLSGEPAAVDRCVTRLRTRGVEVRPLRVERAFHSPLMRGVIAKFEPLLRATRFEPARLRTLANVTGRWAGPDELSRASYWLEQILNPVRFASCVDALTAASVPLVIEIGPAPVLTALGQRSRGGRAARWVPSLRPGRDARGDMLEALATCWSAGCDIDGQGLALGGRRLVALPTYPFQRERFWVDSVEPASGQRVERAPAAPIAIAAATPAPIEVGRGRLAFGIMFFNGVEADAGPEKYRFMLDASRYADDHGFDSVWLPERHFTTFGSLYPNPATLHAAIARETRRVRLMGGSVVLPLHHPHRIVEEWSVVDNLSGGRVGMSLASGWNPDDFALAPDHYRDRQDRLFQGIDDLRRLWRGEAIEVRNGAGQVSRLRAYPTPVQPELPLWITAAGNPATFERAGATGAHLLTHLLDHDVHELAEKIARYRDARRRHGHDPDAGQVVVMLHTFVGDDERAVHGRVRGPYCEFLKANAHLLKGLATSRGSQADIATLSEADRDAFVGFLYDRFFSKRGLIGTPETCLALIDQLKEIGVNEIACLLDFGPSFEDVRAALPALERLIARAQGRATAAPDRAAAVAASSVAPAQESTYRVTWPVATLMPKPAAGRRWIVCADHTGVGAAVLQRLRSTGQPCVGLDPDDAWEDSLQAALVANPGATVLYLWHLDTAEGALTPALDRAARAVRVVTKAGGGRDAARLWFVTRDAQLVPGQRALVSPPQAALWGFVRVLPIEEPRAWGGLIDVSSAVHPDAQAAQILDAATSDVREDQIACRDGQFHAARLSPTDVPAAVRAFTCREHAAYLVTGGTGGLGLAAAGWLVDRGARTVVLCSRTALPARGDWASLPDSHPQAGTVRAIEALEQRGAAIETAALDVGAPGALATLVRHRASAGRPDIRGVVHAAGAWLDAPLARTDVDMLAAVLRPKVEGTDAITATFAGTTLDLFVGFSAFSAVLPAERQGSYAAANAYLDAAMTRRQQEGAAGLAINWGPWSDIGFATTEYGARAHGRLKTIGIHRLTPAEGIGILDRLVCADAGAMGVMPVTWSQLFQADPNARLSPLLSELLARHGAESERPAGAADGPLARAMLERTSEEQPEILRHGLRTIVTTVMRVDPATLRDDVSFTEMGVDSLMAVEIKNRIQHETGIELPLVHLLEGPSVSSLTATLLAAIKMALLASRPAPAAAGEDLEEIEI